MSQIDYSSEVAETLTVAINKTISAAILLGEHIPGSRIITKYVYHSYQNDPFRLLLELLLVVFMVWYFVAKQYLPGPPDVILTEKEINELITEWEPEPLIAPLTDFQRFELEKTTVITGQIGKRTKTIDGKEKLNFASFDFLTIMNSEPIKEKALEALRRYGVGTCGPRGFYGTLDVHLELEQKIANFLGLEASIIYAQGFSCISSVIPAFAKRGDVILADKEVNFAIQKGLAISRSNIYYYNHNDLEDLERIMNEVAEERRKKKLPLCRNFLVTEGIFINYGDMSDLPGLIALKNKYKYRLILDESVSLGTVGNGTGLSSFYKTDPSEIDILCASMANAFGANGGFCAGSIEIAAHQRLSGQAYTYSASMPAMLTVAAIEAISYIEDNPERVSLLTENSILMKQLLEKSLSEYSVKLLGFAGSPIYHIVFRNRLGCREDEEIILQEIVDLALRDGILLTRAKYAEDQEKFCPGPSIRVTIGAGFTKKEIEKCANVIKDACRRTMRKYQLG